MRRRVHAGPAAKAILSTSAKVVDGSWLIEFDMIVEAKIGDTFPSALILHRKWCVTARLVERQVGGRGQLLRDTPAACGSRVLLRHYLALNVRAPVLDPFAPR